MPVESDWQCVETWAQAGIDRHSTPPNIDLPRRIWSTQSPQWISDVRIDRESSIKLPAGVHAAFGCPIQSGEEILGVITFFSREVRPIERNLLQTMIVIGNQLGQFINRKQAELALRQEQARTEQLLLNVLPASIVTQLKAEQGTIAQHFANVTVLFADLVNFTAIAASLPPIALVNLLNQVFSAFDRLTEQYGLEKIKTIGDAYRVVGGLPQARADHAQAIAAMALDMQVELDRLNAIHGQALIMRIGIHSGSVIAGVIGIKKFAYDLWGETVNIASRMESHGVAGRIQVSQATYQLVRHQFVLEKRGCTALKGQGEMIIYWLCSR